MTTPTHTPGPWRVSALRESHLTVEAAHAVVAECYGRARGPDARLIAAAPDMLRVLRLVLKRLDIEAAERGEDAVFLCAGLRGDIRAVIAQAEGGPRL